MKHLFALSMLICFAMVCSCQKQSTTAERQLAQRKAELDAREKALDEREKTLAEREKASTESENPTASARTPPPDVKSGRKIESRIQELPPDARRLIPDPEQVTARREAKMQ